MSAGLERHLVAGWYGPQPVLWAVPLSALFWLLRTLRTMLYRAGLVRPERLPCSVVVVGNVTAGGSGKTPLVLHLVGALRAAGHRPGVLTRGYGRRGVGCQLVEAGASAEQVGDEALLLARRGGVPVMVGADRVAAAHRLLQVHPEIDVLVCDDGMQHARLARDAEVLVVDGRRGFGNGWLLPAGPLREPPGPALARAVAVVRNGAVAPASAGLPAATLTMALAPDDLVQLSDGASAPLAAFAGREVHAVAGIGDPERFFAMLEAGGVRLRRHPRSDHAPLAAAELEFGDGLPVLLTEKDAVKLPVGLRPGVWCVPVTARFAPDQAARLLAAVEARIAPRPAR